MDTKSTHSTFKASGAGAALAVMRATTLASEAQIPGYITANHLSDAVRAHTYSDGSIDWPKVHRALVTRQPGSGEA